jgi:hypothetical protein
MEEVNNEISDIEKQSNFRKKLIRAHRPADGKVCVYIICTSKQNEKAVNIHDKVSKFILESSSNHIYWNYLSKIFDDRKINYSLDPGTKYQFDHQGKELYATIEDLSIDMCSIYGDRSIVNILFIEADTKEIIETFLESLEDTKHNHIKQYDISRSNWVDYRKIVKRKDKTLILKQNIYETIMHDIDDFVNSEDDYTKYGIPYKKVLLFHGKPGTGKTSIVRIMASKLNRDIYNLVFDAEMTDSKINSAISTIKSDKAILLIEDIDCLFNKRGTKDNMSSASFSSLLNILDGASVNEGMITIITTNHPEALDAALHRPLRVDLVVKFDKADAHQIKGIFDMYEIDMEDRALEKIVEHSEMNDVTPAGISAFLFKNRKEGFNGSKDIITKFKTYVKDLVIADKDKSSMHM